jgi:hypothetical protein
MIMETGARSRTIVLIPHGLALSLLLLSLAIARPALSQTYDAAFIAGSYTITPNANGTSATMQLAGVQDNQSGGSSGSLGFELWYLPTPFSGAGGPPITGFKVAEAYLPIGNCLAPDLAAGAGCSGIVMQSNLTLPSSGTYYPVLFLVEYSSSCTTNNGYCYIDDVPLKNLATGGATVTVHSSTGGNPGGGATGNAVFTSGGQVNSINWTSQTADITVPAITNNSTNLSGSLAVVLWLQSVPYNGTTLDAGYQVALYALPASCTTGQSQLAAGAGCTAFDTGTIAVAPPPAGVYYAVLALEEYCGGSNSNGYCLDNALSFQSTFTVPSTAGGSGNGSSSGANGGVQLSGSQSASYDYTSGTVDLSIGGVSNTTSNTTGTIEVELWFLTTPYAGSGGFTGTKVASYRLPATCTVGDNQLAPNSGCTAFDSGTITATFPAAGTYYGVLAVSEYNNNSACASNGSFCLDSAIQLNGTATVPSVTTPIATPDSSGGGGGALDILALATLGLLVVARITFVRIPIRNRYESRSS